MSGVRTTQYYLRKWESRREKRVREKGEGKDEEIDSRSYQLN
jgi:hypothetical protein